MITNQFNINIKTIMSRKNFLTIRLLICLATILPFTQYAANGSALVHMAGYRANMAMITLVTTKHSFSNGSLSYIIGGIIAVLLMIYLVYTLLKPEKF